jgi:hypothetical protein
MAERDWVDEAEEYLAELQKPDPYPMRGTPRVEELQLGELLFEHAREAIAAVRELRQQQATPVWKIAQLSHLQPIVARLRDLKHGETILAELLVWHRVEDGLPKRGAVVLGAWGGGAGEVWFNEDGTWTVEQGALAPMEVPVTHWAELPKGPTP